MALNVQRELRSAKKGELPRQMHSHWMAEYFRPRPGAALRLGTARSEMSWAFLYAVAIQEQRAGTVQTRSCFIRV
jgi:hypothetical protein